MKKVDGVAYDLRGRGAPPLLLLRPAGGSSALWGKFRDLLAERRTVISMDHRGTGESDAPPVTISTEDLARDAIAVVGDAGYFAFDIFGVSLGGMVATWVAALADDRVRRLVLASTPLRGRDVGSFRSVGDAAAGLKLAACLARSEEEILACLTEDMMSDGFRERHPADAQARIEEARGETVSRLGLVALVAAAARHDGSEALPKIKAEVMVVAGGDDVLLSLDAQTELVVGFQKARFETLPGAGHDVTLERPEQMARLVASFLDA